MITKPNFLSIMTIKQLFLRMLLVIGLVSAVLVLMLSRVSYAITPTPQQVGPPITIQTSTDKDGNVSTTTWDKQGNSDTTTTDKERKRHKQIEWSSGTVPAAVQLLPLTKMETSRLKCKRNHHKQGQERERHKHHDSRA